jgi:SOS-response transcriptional repressor LexA
MHHLATKVGDPPTPRQAEMLDFIRGHIRDHGFSPSVREIGAALGITSPNGVLSQIRALEKKGRLTRVLNTSRSFRLVGDDPADLAASHAELRACCELALAHGGILSKTLMARMERAVEASHGAGG